MGGGTWQAFTATLVGGVAVALITFLSTRQKIHAEADKYRAEAERTRAETAKLLLETTSSGTTSPSDSSDHPPTKWFKTGSHPDDYTVGIDRKTFYRGSASAYISARADPKGFATLMQHAKADLYQDKRVRLSAYVKTKGVGGRVGLWMRIDGKGRREMLAFDNMDSRRISGTTDWTRYDIVLDVSKAADTLNYGILLAGSGTAWIDQIRFEVVGDEVPVTDTVPHASLCASPANLDFEDD